MGPVEPVTRSSGQALLDVPDEARCSRDGAEEGRVSGSGSRAPAAASGSPPPSPALPGCGSSSPPRASVWDGAAWGPSDGDVRPLCPCVLHPEPGSHASTRLLAGPQCTRVQMVLVRASATCHTGEGWWWRPCPEGGCSWGEQAEEWQWRQESAAGAGHLRPRVHADHHRCRGRGPFIRGACWLRPCSVVAHCPVREGGSPHVLGEATPPTACWGSSSSPGEPCSQAGRGSLAEQHGGL